MVYKTSGVCSSAISFEIDEQGKVHDVKFQGGCSGNTQGVAKLIEGMDVVNKIAEVATDYQDKPMEPQVMASVTVETFGEEYPEPEKF